MNDTAYLVWFIGTALATIIILATTTLASAGLLRRAEQPTAIRDDVASALDPLLGTARRDLENGSDTRAQERAA